MNLIKIVSIPEEIIILDKENIRIENNSYLEGDNAYKLYQNKNLTKTSQYYYLDYQYILKEGNSVDNDEAHEGIEDLKRQLENGGDLKLRSLDNLNEEAKRIYYGTTNRLKFKLCHDYCETCDEISMEKNDQKCSSCPPIYQYDYRYYIDNSFDGNCVPEGYFYDFENSYLKSCNNVDYKFYINTTDNKKICFHNNNDCPESYPYFNDTTKECLYCSYERYKAGDCVLDDNRTNNTVHDNIKGFISTLPEGSNMKVSDRNNFYFQVTNTANELSSLSQSRPNTEANNSQSIIDLKECTDILKRVYGYDNDTELIILKYENEASTNDKSVQYEVYGPDSSTKLNLSYCSDVKIDIYIPVVLDEKTQELYESLKEQGYNLFDKNDKFYTDICTPYKSPNGTDVLLSDRFNDFFLSESTHMSS